MVVVYQAIFEYEKEKNKLFLTQILSDGSHDKSLVNLKDVEHIEKMCKDFDWNQSSSLSQQVGEKIFNLLNGDRQTLTRSLEKADANGECLQIQIRPDGPVSDLPFELLYDQNYLALSRAHIVHRISDWGCDKNPKPKSRPLKILFIACSPDNGSHTLDFEKEEEAIYETTKGIPVEIDVEDTGSLKGLGEILVHNEYDVIHLSGHAGINDDGTPFFIMEDEEGLPIRVTPSELWSKLKLSPPRLLFLSGCSTGKISPHTAAVSFAQHLVDNHSSTVLGWGLPVSDTGASFAAKQLYFELSRGKDILESVHFVRDELYEHHKTVWSLLRLFSDGIPLNIPLVKENQKVRAKPRDIQYEYLRGSQVKILKKGFVGRRRQIQQGIRSLIKNEEKIGLLLHGTGGLGKSCLVGKFCERLKDHTLIIVHGKLDAITFCDALKKGFVRGEDEKGLEILKEDTKLPDKLQKMCSSCFQEKNYLIILDDFEQNMPAAKEGRFDVSSGALELLETLLKYLPDSAKMSQLIITCRYTFSLTCNGINQVEHKLESIGLTSFQGADERKKVPELKHIDNYPDPEIRQQIIEAGRGNPLLMDELNTLLGESKDLDIISLLSAVKDKQDEFVQNLILKKILESQSDEFHEFMRRSAVFRLPVLKQGLGLVCKDMDDWDSHITQAVRLSLMEQEGNGKSNVLYWVTPLLRESIFRELEEKDRKMFHCAAASYYKNIISSDSGYAPIIAIELIEHALHAGMDRDAIKEGGRLLSYLRGVLAYKEALSIGNSIISRIYNPEKDEKYSKLLFELAWLSKDFGDAKKAKEYYEQILSIDKELYGERDPNVATVLSNIGGVWNDLGDAKKAKEYYEQALSINKQVYGERHSSVAIDLSNLGLALRDLGDAKEALDYFEQALSIDKEVYGERHPTMAIILSNLGGVLRDLGDAKKSKEYYEQALSIDKEIYGERHPSVATRLNNLGLAWCDFGDAKKAKDYYEQALSITKEVYGERHPNVAISLSNLGAAWRDLGDAKKTKEYIQEALSIAKEVYGKRHPNVATILNNYGIAWSELGDAKKAKECLQDAYEIFLEFYGDEHPDTINVKRHLEILKKEI